MNSDEATLRSLFSAGCKLLAIFLLVQTLISLAPSLRILNRSDSGALINFLAVTVPGLLWPIGLLVAANPLSRWLVSDRPIPSIPEPTNWFRPLLTLVIIFVALISLLTALPTFSRNLYEYLRADHAYVGEQHLVSSTLEVILSLGFILGSGFLAKGVIGVLEWTDSVLTEDGDSQPLETETWVALIFWVGLIIVFFVSYLLIEA